MCLTLPETLITVMGIEKIVPKFEDLEVFLQLLPRASTGERMNPYTSMWTGVHEGDGPRSFHLILLDNGRTDTLADTVGRQALACIRCSACLNVCPVYERTGGHAYGSVYPGPIGAVLTPQLAGIEHTASLPFASTLCGACYDACPVKIDIPEVLVHLRAKVVEAKRAARRTPTAEALAMKASAKILTSPKLLSATRRVARLGARSLARNGAVGPLPGPGRAWSDVRDTPVPPSRSFRDWWSTR
jgi:L-lactate dehydrogenase complex protein LldF